MPASTDKGWVTLRPYPTIDTIGVCLWADFCSRCKPTDSHNRSSTESSIPAVEKGFPTTLGGITQFTCLLFSSHSQLFGNFLPSLCTYPRLRRVVACCSSSRPSSITAHFWYCACRRCLVDIASQVDGRPRPKQLIAGFREGDPKQNFGSNASRALRHLRALRTV